MKGTKIQKGAFYKHRSTHYLVGKEDGKNKTGFYRKGYVRTHYIKNKRRVRRAIIREKVWVVYVSKLSGRARKESKGRHFSSEIAHKKWIDLEKMDINEICIHKKLMKWLIADSI